MLRKEALSGGVRGGYHPQNQLLEQIGFALIYPSSYDRSAENGANTQATGATIVPQRLKSQAGIAGAAPNGTEESLWIFEVSSDTVPPVFLHANLGHPVVYGACDQAVPSVFAVLFAHLYGNRGSFGVFPH